MSIDWQRRNFLFDSAWGFGSLALSSMLAGDLVDTSDEYISVARASDNSTLR